MKKYYFIDLFCGAGGTTTGIVNHAEVIACINHDANAIASHTINHPNSIHFTEDIRTVSLTPIIEMVNKIRIVDPNAVICLWASLECTNHSNAKGGMSRDADSRTLAEHLFRYIEALNPDMIWIENVREFKAWGPLKIKSKEHKLFSELIMSKPTKKNPEPAYTMVPDKRYKGKDYDIWVENVKKYGYSYEDRVLNAADYGCDTSRRRLFIQFAKSHIKISWPSPSHDKFSIDGRLPWRPVRPLLDLEDAGKSIFEKDKPWAEASLRRKLRGLKKFVHEPFFVKYYGNGDNTCGIDVPCPTLTVKDRIYFLKSEYGKSTGSSLGSPCPALTGNPKESLMQVNFLKCDYSSGGQSRSIDEPAPALMAKRQKESLVTVNFLYDHQFNNSGNSIDNPCPTLIARQDKKPLYLLTAELKNHPLNWVFKKVRKSYKKSKAMAGIVEFMIDKNISDIKVRPLRIKEMLKITGFPDTYKLIGTQTEQKKYIGNAVPCYQVSVLIGHSKKINN